ncbi:MAG: hypothetical protein HY051_01685 [Candidatus Aenigmarchaeota archaeon]|nr:hypothetical protein [Candidatus Aenigmarchaeota archaeon]
MLQINSKIIKIEPSIKSLKKINIRGSIKEGNSSGRFYIKGHLVKVPDMGDDGLGHRYFLLPASEKKMNADYFQGVPMNRSQTKEVPYPNFFDFEEDFNNVGYEGGVEFRNGKKPVRFINKILEISGGVKKRTQ